jgi:predicted dehydrogenase
MIKKVLIVGHGSIGKRHLRLARELLPEADIRVLHHNKNSEPSALSNGSFYNLHEACAFSPEIAVIANPAPFHLEVATTLAKAGANLLIEKPLCTSALKAQNFLEAIKPNEITLQVGYNLRFLPSMQQFRELIINGAIGQAISVRCEVGQHLSSWRSDQDYRTGVSARSELGGGVLLELSHEFDYLRWIFGEVKWVNAWLGHQSALDINVEDTAHLILGFAANKNHHHMVATLSLDCLRFDTTRICTVIGDQGTLKWDGIRGVIEHFSPQEQGWKIVFSNPSHRDDSYRAQWLNFLSSLENKTLPLVTGEDGKAVIDIIEAARQSHLCNGARIIV